MESQPSSKQPERPNLAAVTAQIVDKMGIDDLLYYGGPRAFWDNFKASRSVAVECFTDTLIGAERPMPSNLVVCVDYLHSVGMLKIKDVLDELRRVTRLVGFFQVTTDVEVEEGTTINQPVAWWLDEFIRRFDLQSFQRIPGGFYVIVYAKVN